MVGERALEHVVDRAQVGLVGQAVALRARRAGRPRRCAPSAPGRGPARPPRPRPSGSSATTCGRGRSRRRPASRAGARRRRRSRCRSAAPAVRGPRRPPWPARRPTRRARRCSGRPAARRSRGRRRGRRASGPRRGRGRCPRPGSGRRGRVRRGSRASSGRVGDLDEDLVLTRARPAATGALVGAEQLGQPLDRGPVGAVRAPRRPSPPAGRGPSGSRSAGSLSNRLSSGITGGHSSAPRRRRSPSGA